MFLKHVVFRVLARSRRADDCTSAARADLENWRVLQQLSVPATHKWLAASFSVGGGYVHDARCEVNSGEVRKQALDFRLTILCRFSGCVEDLRCYLGEG